MNEIIIEESVRIVLGVRGIAHRIVADGKRIVNQTWKSSREIVYYGKPAIMIVELRFDDNCRNGHSSFSITADIKKKNGTIEACGCLHDDIKEWFPELAPLIPWHLTSTDGPMHYMANTVYAAGNRDHNGLLKGEKRQIRNGRTGIPAWKLVTLDEAGNEIELYKLKKYQDAEQPPIAPYRLVYVPWDRIGEGKERDLNLARQCAVWPEATDEELCSPDLPAMLAARLPGLIERFRTAMTQDCGFIWSA